MKSEHDSIRRLGPELRGKLFVIKMARRADKESLFCGREKLKHVYLLNILSKKIQKSP